MNDTDHSRGIPEPITVGALSSSFLGSQHYVTMKTALVIFVLLALLGVTVGWVVWGWEQTAGTAMGFHGWLAMILGIVFTIVVGCGLMGLMFYSSRYGYDERASHLSDKNKKNYRLLRCILLDTYWTGEAYSVLNKTITRGSLT